MFRKYTIIEHAKRGKIQFHLYPFQEEVLADFHSHRFVIVNKSRQMGLSTLVAAHALHSMLFKDGFKVLVIATKQDVAKNLVHKVKVMHRNLPVFLRQKVIDDNKLELSFDNGSSIKAVSSSPDAGRSEALSLLILDEYAHIDYATEIWTAARSTLATGGNAVVLSTPNGVGNQFHKMWVQATEGVVEEGLEAFHPIELMWDLHPERDETFEKIERTQLGERAFAQEYACDFISSGHTVVDGLIIKWYEDNLVEEPIEKRGPGGDYWLWEYPSYNKDYIVVADVSRGDSSDYSTFHVLELETMKQVAEYRGMMDSRQFGNFLVGVATDWNNALLVIPNKNIGWDTVQQAIDREYKNLYYSFRNDPYLDKAIHIRKGHDLKKTEDKVPGFTESGAVRSVQISKLIMYFNTEKPLIIKSQRTINELYTFIWLNGKAQAAQGYNDDLVIALSIGLFMHDIALKMRSIGMDLTKKTLDNTYRAVYTPPKKQAPEWTMQVGGKNESLTWLL